MRMTTLLPALMSAALLLPATAAIGQQAAPAPAATEDSGGSTPAAKPKKEKPKTICRSIPHEQQSYSRIATRVCKTQAEWDSQAQTSDTRMPGAMVH